MNITIIGTGNMARGIGTRLVAGGNSVTLLSRNPEKGAELAANLQAAARQGASAQAVLFGSPIQDEVVILAVPYHAVAETIQPYRAQLTGKILVDITNPVKATFDGLATPPDSSAAQEIASQPLDVFITGDDAAAKATVSQLVEAGGLRAIDAGPLAHAHYLEGLAFLGMKLQFTLGTQFQSAWKLLA